MKVAIIVALLAGSAQAASKSLDAALGAASGLAQATAARLASKTNMLPVNACYERVGNAEADRLGLPKRLCLETLSILMPERDPQPLSYDAYLSATGVPAAPRMHITGAAREADGWELVGSWLSLWSAKDPVCGRLNSAHASVYVKSTLDGTLKDAPVVVRAFLMDGASLCRTSAATIYFDYARL